MNAIIADLTARIADLTAERDAAYEAGDDRTGDLAETALRIAEAKLAAEQDLARG